MARICLGLQDCLYLGNLDAKRDWGHARDFVEAQWRILQQPEPDDFVIATGQQHSVREFCEKAFEMAGIDIEWKDKGKREAGIVSSVRENPMVAASDIRIKPGDRIIAIDRRYFRPTEVDTLIGDAGKARRKLGWSPRTSFEEMIREMVETDFEIARKDALCQKAGFKVFNHNEE